MRPAPVWAGVAALLLCALVAGVGLMRFGVWPGLALCATTGAALVVAVALFEQGLWLRLVEPASALTLAAFGGVSSRSFVEDAEKRKVSRLFGRYVSRDVYKQLMANPERPSSAAAGARCRCSSQTCAVLPPSPRRAIPRTSSSS